MTMTLIDQAAAYVAMKQATGLTFVNEARMLRGFAAHAEARGDRFTRVATVLEWASQASSPNQRANRLRIVCGFAEHLRAEDTRHEIPHRDSLGRASRCRPPPHLLSIDETRRIMDAALALPPAGSITPHAFHTMFDLMAATGMRPSETTGLRVKDLTEDGLEIHNAKLGNARFLPLHETVRRALEAYLEKRGPGAADDPLFILSTGRAASPGHLSGTFVKLARSLGLRGKPGMPGPRLYDLRHSFATRALEGVTFGDRRTASRHMLALSTWLGHKKIVDTYWYLEATPVLLERISAATEDLESGGRQHG